MIMELSNMKPQVSQSHSGKVRVEQPHQMHMRFIKNFMPENLSWSQFAAHLYGDASPVTGSRKQRLEKTASYLSEDPSFMDEIVRGMGEL